MAEVAWNPRYIHYARVHNRTPDEMLMHDEERFPGGQMCGFIIWIRKQWQAWSKLPERGRKFPGSRVASDAAHRDFDEWLASVKA